MTVLKLIIAMTLNLVSKGIALNYTAQHSGSLTDEMITKSLDALPQALTHLREKWEGINSSVVSGLCPRFDGGPFDDFVRGGSVQPHLSHHVPTAGGAPKSRGIVKQWPHGSLPTRPLKIHEQWLSGGDSSNTQLGNSNKGVWYQSCKAPQTKVWEEDGHMRWLECDAQQSRKGKQINTTYFPQSDTDPTAHYITNHLNHIPPLTGPPPPNLHTPPP